MWAGKYMERDMIWGTTCEQNKQQHNVDNRWVKRTKLVQNTNEVCLGL